MGFNSGIKGLKTAARCNSCDWMADNTGHVRLPMGNAKAHSTIPQEPGLWQKLRGEEDTKYKCKSSF